jgi:hypothetical protein
VITIFVQRAAAHEGQRRHLDDVALEVGRDLLGIDHVVQRVEQRPQVRVDLRHEVARQEAEALARLDGRAREDDPVDLAPRQRGGGHRHREEGLAGAGGADAERDRVAADRVDVALLVDGLRGDLRRPVTPHHVLQDLGRRVVLVERARDRLDRPLGDLVPLLDELGELAHDHGGLCDRLGVAVEGDDVAAQEQVAVHVLLERAEDVVACAGERLGDLV